MSKTQTDQNSPSTNNDFALHDACVRGNLADVSSILDQLNNLSNEKSMGAVMALFRKGTASTAVTKKDDKNGLTPLHYAALHKNSLPQIIKNLIKLGALPNQNDNPYGLTPLHIACAANNMPAVVALISAGASVTLRTKDAKTPVEFTTSSDIIEHIKNHAASKKACYSRGAATVGIIGAILLGAAIYENLLWLGLAGIALLALTIIGAIKCYALFTVSCAKQPSENFPMQGSNNFSLENIGVWLEKTFDPQNNDSLLAHQSIN